MFFKDKLSQITELSQRIKAQELPDTTPHQEQAAITMADVEKTILDLIKEKLSVKVIFLSLFYFWLMLEAPLRRVSEKQVEEWTLPLEKAVERILEVVKAVVDSLPDHNPTVEMVALGEKINDLKQYLAADAFDRLLPRDDLLKQTPIINTRIHTITSNLLKQSVHPEIVSNVLFGYWLRLLTLQTGISEEYYQKIEFYFTEIINAARREIPLLF